MIRFFVQRQGRDKECGICAINIAHALSIQAVVLPTLYSTSFDVLTSQTPRLLTSARLRHEIKDCEGTFSTAARNQVGRYLECVICAALIGRLPKTSTLRSDSKRGKAHFLYGAVFS